MPVAAVSLAAAGILSAFDRFLARRQQEEADEATEILESEAPDLSPDEIGSIVDSEVALERAYQAKARARLDRDLPRALSIGDAGERTLRVQAILDREQRYLAMRESAVAKRALGAGEQRSVEREAPEGGFWKLSPYVREHTPDCLAMGGKVWPHTILRNFHPPLHGGCECEVITPQRAISEGLLPAGWQPRDAHAGDQALPALALTESLWVDPEVLDDELALLEAPYGLRYPSGTEHGGEFRPRRGGNPGAALRMKRRLPRMHLDAEVRPVAAMGQENDVRHIPVGELKAGDHVHVNGSLERVTSVKSPGLFELERTGLVHTDRPTVRGVPAGEAPAAPATKAARDLAKGDVFERFGRRYTVVGNERGTGGRGRSIMATAGSGERVVLPIGATEHVPVHGVDGGTVEPSGAAASTAHDFNPSEHPVGDMLVKTRQALIGKLRNGGTFTMPGDVRVSAGGFLSGSTHGSGADRERPHRVHFPGGHVDVNGAQNATMEALHRSAQSEHPDSIGGSTRYGDFREPFVTGEQRRLGAPHGGLVGFAPHGQPVFGRTDRQGHVQGWTAKQVTADGAVSDPNGSVDPIRRLPEAPKPPEPTPTGPDYGGHHGLPELPRFPEGDRFEMRFAPNAELDIHDREKGKTHARFGEWNLEHVQRITGELNADDRAAKQAKTPAPTPAVPERLSHADVVSIANMRKPDAGGEIKPGVHFNPEVSRSEARGADLHLPEGYFKQSKALRQNVIFRHFGRQIAESHGQRLGEQDAHLRSAKGVVDTYTALNGPSRDEYAALHPEAARLVAGSARELGLPLHPEAAKLAGAPAAAHAAPSEHPAHALAKLVKGEDYRAASDRLREAGYAFELQSRAEPRLVSHVNLETGARINIETRTGVGGTTIEKATPEVFGNRPVPESVQALVGQGAGVDVPGTYTTSLHPWMAYTSADGTSFAAHEGSDGRIDRVVSYPPTPAMVAEARRAAISHDPIANTRPGDDFETVRAALDYGHSYSPTQSREVPSSGVIAPEGATHYTDFRPTRNDAFTFENVRVYTREKPGGGYEVVAIGHQHPSAPQMLTPEQFASELAKAQEQRRLYFEQRQRDEQAATEARGRVAEIVKAGDAKAATKALSGQKVTDVISALRAQGYEVRGRRQSGRGTERAISYRLRAPDGSNVRLVAGHTFGDQNVRKVEITGNPQGGNRTRILGPWANRKELYTDALGRADELGERFGANVHVTAIHDEGAGRGTLAHHEWNGSIVMGTGSGFTKRFDSYLKRRSAGEKLTDAEHMDFYDAMSTLQHEINHGVGKAGENEGGLAFGSKHYRGAGKAMEEALTEESARALTIDWLRANGLTDVLRAVKRNPGHRSLNGSYPEYRARLKAALDKAGVPTEERTALLYRWKFQMSPEERQAELGRLLGGDATAGARAMQRSASYSTSDRSTYQVAPDDPISDVEAGTKSTADLMRGDRVVVRTREGDAPGAVRYGGTPTNPSIAVQLDDGRNASFSPDEIVSIGPSQEIGQPPKARVAGGRTIEINSPVEVDTSDGRIPGRVIEIDPLHPSEIKVERSDGMTLWTSASRLR